MHIRVVALLIKPIDLLPIIGHIKFIRFKEYYGIPRGALAQYLCALFGQKENFNAYFSGKMRLFNITSKHGTTIFFPI